MISLKKDNKGIFGLLGLFQKSAVQENGTKGKTSVAPMQKNNDQPYLPNVGKRHRIVGLEHRKANVMKLAKENPLYKLDKSAILKRGLADTYIHKYTFTDGPTELVQESDNPHDPNAIKVIVSGQHIGYIKVGSCAHLNKVINDGRVEKILCRIYGGPYKGAFQDYDETLDAGFTGKPTYIMETGTEDIRAEIRVIETNAK